MLHFLILTFFPRQSRPSNAGLGFVQDLPLVWFPVPQPSKQVVDVDQADHFDQRPLTGPR